MTDADTPRVPDLWWSPKLGVLRKEHDAHDSFHVFGGGTSDGWGSFLAKQWPADAVKLGDVKAAEHEAWQQGWEAGATANATRHRAEHETVQRELDKLRADIRAVLDEDRRGPFVSEGQIALAKMRDIRAVLDREPGREEPSNGNLWEQIRDNARLVEGRISTDELFGDYSAYRPAVVQETACARREDDMDGIAPDAGQEDE